MKKILIILTFSVFSGLIYSQEYTELDFNDFSKYTMKMLNNDGLELKVIFSDSVEASFPAHKKIEDKEIAFLEGFSEEKFVADVDGIFTVIPFLKIKLNNEILWIKSSDAFIFNYELQDTSFIVNRVVYNVYLAGNLKFVSDAEDYSYYSGYRLIVIENTQTQQYFFLTNNVFPLELEGHSYKSGYVYLQDDFGVNEIISKININDNCVEFQISAQYQDGKASYSIIFCVDDLSSSVEYKSIIVVY